MGISVYIIAYFYFVWTLYSKWKIFSFGKIVQEVIRNKVKSPYDSFCPKRSLIILIMLVIILQTYRERA